MTDDFGAAVGRMVSAGYVLHSCPPACPDHGDEAHAHLTNPADFDFIARADGTVDSFDLTRSTAPVPVPRRRVL